MFDLTWDERTFTLIGISLLLILICAAALMYKMKRVIKKWAYAGLMFGKALLIGTLFIGGDSNHNALWAYTPNAFHKAMMNTDFDFSYEKDRITFKNESGTSGFLKLHNGKISFYFLTTVYAPKNIEHLYSLTNAFLSSDQLPNQMRSLIKNKVNQRIQLSNGHVELYGNMIELSVEKPISQDRDSYWKVGLPL